MEGWESLGKCAFSKSLPGSSFFVATKSGGISKSPGWARSSAILAVSNGLVSTANEPQSVYCICICKTESIKNVAVAVACSHATTNTPAPTHHVSCQPAL